MKINKLCIIGLFCLFLASFSVSADTIGLTGSNMTTNAGAIIASGNLVVTIHDAPTGGNQIYSSGTDFNNNITNGNFDVLVGSGTVPLTLNHSKTYYLDISAAGEDRDFNGNERQAFQAPVGNVTADRIHITDTIRTQTIEPHSDSDYNLGTTTSRWANIYADTINFVTKLSGLFIADNAINTTHIEDGTILGDDISSSTDIHLGGGGASGGITLRGTGSLKGQGQFRELLIGNETYLVDENAVNGSFTPYQDDTFDLGNTSNRWRKGVYSDVVDVGGYHADKTLFSQSIPVFVGKGGFLGGKSGTNDESFFVTSNLYQDSAGNWEYLQSAQGSAVFMYNGIVDLVVAPTGTAGDDASVYTTALSVKNSGAVDINSLDGSYSNGEAYVCVYNNGTIFAKDSACS